MEEDELPASFEAINLDELLKDEIQTTYLNNEETQALDLSSDVEDIQVISLMSDSEGIQIDDSSSDDQDNAHLLIENTEIPAELPICEINKEYEMIEAQPPMNEENLLKR